MGQDAGQFNLSSRQLRVALNASPRNEVLTEIGQARVIHTIFGNAKVRIIRQRDQARHTWLKLLLALSVAVLATAIEEGKSRWWPQSELKQGRVVSTDSPPVSNVLLQTTGAQTEHAVSAIISSAGVIHPLHGDGQAAKGEVATLHHPASNEVQRHGTSSKKVTIIPTTKTLRQVEMPVEPADNNALKGLVVEQVAGTIVPLPSVAPAMPILPIEPAGKRIAPQLESVIKRNVPTLPDEAQSGLGSDGSPPAVAQP